MRRDGVRPAPQRAPRAVVWWYGLMGLGGTMFGLLGDRRPFGADVLAHPFVIFFALVGVALLVLRVALARPVPDLLPERALLIGSCIGGAAFLAGNWAAAHLMAIR